MFCWILSLISRAENSNAEVNRKLHLHIRMRSVGLNEKKIKRSHLNKVKRKTRSWKRAEILVGVRAIRRFLQVLVLPQYYLDSAKCYSSARVYQKSERKKIISKRNCTCLVGTSNISRIRSNTVNGVACTITIVLALTQTYLFIYRVVFAVVAEQRRER